MNYGSQVPDKEAIAQYEARLKEAEDRLRLALSVTGLGIFDWIKTKSGPELFWDRGMNRIFALDYQDPRDRMSYLISVTHREDLPGMKKYFELVKANNIKKDKITGTFRICMPDGSLTHIQYQGKHIRNSEGELIRIIGFCQDVSKRRKAEIALQENERRYAQILRDQTESIVRWKPGGIILFVNDAYCKAVGLPREALVGNSFFPLMTPENFQRLQNDISKLRPDNSVCTRISFFTNLQGEIRWMEWSDRAFFHKNGKLREVQAIGRDITERIEAQQKLKSAYEEVDMLKRKLEEENHYLQQEIQLTHNFDDIIYGSEELEGLLDLVNQVAPVDATVLISGETGTGKELIARAVHANSQRKHKALVKINCATLPRDLIESELFGHEKGAFSGAIKQKIGRFELAHNGTLFLDEIGELPVELQPKLLRIIQEGEFERIGGTETLKINVRIIAATNRDLKQEVEEGRFREDLYYRLHVFPIEIPPLRERKKDIAPLASFFINKYGKKFGKSSIELTPIHIHQLESYDWPGNVRELEHLVERALILSKGEILPFARLLGLQNNPKEGVDSPSSMKEVERTHILKILRKANWKINGPGGAAERLELSPSTLRDRMKKLDISRPIDKH